jgi:hypothetical protein
MRTNHSYLSNPLCWISMIFMVIGLTTGCPFIPGGCLPDQNGEDASSQQDNQQGNSGDQSGETSRSDIQGDLNDDGVIDNEDLELFLDKYQPSFGSTVNEDRYILEADLNNDGIIDFSDLQLFEELLEG